MASFKEVRQLINMELEKKRKSKSSPSNEGQLADALNISRSWLSRMMNEEKLKITHLLKIAEVLGINPASLLSETHDPEPRLSLDEHVRFVVKRELDKYLNERR